MELVRNDILWIAVLSSSLAQFLKPFTYYARTREFSWRHIAGTGGMPSSHSAMVSALAAGVGIEQGFDSMIFAAATVLALIVTYDAAGVRHQAGEHARAINLLIAEVLSGSGLSEEKFDEVLGHSRAEVAAGIVFGIAIMLLWKLIIQPLFVG
ncbi:MAG: divergent PAP2 family protein [Chloroflexi bacterium]|nr:divergent PAP2 family protein [Chloroflexota bacterium]